jgi:hypothetical protein
MKRKLKVEESGDFCRNKTHAVICLKGKWLFFKPNSHVIVEEKDGKLIIQAAN